MRRMYSVKELTTLIKEVFDAELASGALDDKVSDAVDAYLLEHPVDVTALEGQDVELNSLDADGLITGGEIVEKMSGYSFTQRTSDLGWTPIYVGIVKNGNKLTLVVFGTTTNDLESAVSVLADIGYFTIPSSVGEKLYPYTFGIETDILDTKIIKVVDSSQQPYTEAGEDFILNIRKVSSTRIECRISGSLKPGTHYFRIEETFLLSDNLVPEE